MPLYKSQLLFLLILCFSGLSMTIHHTEIQYAVEENNTKRNKKPNIIYILADDLGYRELGSYGQEKIKTPNLDKLAADGMRFTHHYSGSAVCAPSRCVLLTGMHTGHSYIRGNYEVDDWYSFHGQLPLKDSIITLPEMLKKAGYATGAFGKWGLGNSGSEGAANQQGFDVFVGYECQRHAHNYYTDFLIKNGDTIMLNNDFKGPNNQKFDGTNPADAAQYQKYKGKQWSQDIMQAEALKFVRENKEKPFFLYLPYATPHLALQVPDEELEPYNHFDTLPYLGNKGYLPHIKPRAAYAGMISRMDKQIGQILALIKELKLENNTIVMFSSDNGTTFDVGGVDVKFFNSVGELRGLKTSLYEGGIRVPFIVKWQGKVKAGSVSDQVSAFWDIYPTIAEITETKLSAKNDGISILPTLTGNVKEQKQHQYLYWEYDNQQAVLMGKWKAYRNVKGKNAVKTVDAIELYNLSIDPAEKLNVAKQMPVIVKRMKEIMNSRTPSGIKNDKGLAVWDFPKIE